MINGCNETEEELQKYMRVIENDEGARLALLNSHGNFPVFLAYCGCQHVLLATFKSIDPIGLQALMLAH